MEFTAEQREAIDRRDSALFLHAGAGSGKTRVLTERFVQAVIADGVPVERILAITFTEKAAAELKGRVRDRFIELGERGHARAAEAAWISTIHGFCSRLLRTHALAAGLDPEYHVLDEGEAGRLAVDAFDRALEEFLARGDERERLELVATYTPDKLGTMVRTVHSRLRSRGNRAPALPSVAEPEVGDEADRLAAAVEAALGELGSAEGARVEAARAQLERCRAALEGVPPGQAGQASLFSALAVKRGNTGALNTPAFDELSDAHATWTDLCLAVQAHVQYGLMRDLLALYTPRYAALKEARSGLDFEDLELMARDLLLDQPGLSDAYRERFAHVMVDEFQDTNALQDEILGLVADRERTLFTVGDARQSIYLFRNADVSVFENARARAAEAGRAARLATNFRTRADVLAVLNAAFGREDVFGEDFQRLVAHDGDQPRQVADPSVELLVVDKDKARWEAVVGEQGFGPAFAGRLWRGAEARLLGARVAELIGAGACAPGDVAVLVRATTDMWMYERALEDQGIPTYLVGGRGYWSQQQVGDVRAWLAALANPLDELAVYSVLASPLVGASLDALATVGRRAKAAGRDVWWAIESAFGPDGDGCAGLAEAVAEADRERIATFVGRFSDERAAAPRRSLETLIDRAVTRTGYDRVLLAMPAGDRRMANVRKLMRLAREYEADEGRDLRGFIDFVDEQELVRVREGEAPLEAAGLNAVRLMTIHAAKGLEFPVVCVADLGRDGKGDDSALRITDDGRVGLQVASFGSNPAAALDLEQIKAEQLAGEEAEERRVFYVGMTRAERHLIVSGATDLDKHPPPAPLGAPMRWVAEALAPGGVAAALAGGGEAEVEVAGGARVRVVALTPATCDAQLPEAARTPGAGLAGPEEELGAPEPPRFDDVAVPVPLPISRLSYSGLERFRACGYRFYLERILGLPEPLGGPAPPAPVQLALGEEPGADELPGLVRGTVVHELLEQIDFRRPVVPTAERVAATLAANDAPAAPAQVEGIRELVAGFTGSALCKRLAAARRVRQELPFAYTLAPERDGRGLLVNGVVDVHAEEPEATLVVDYKSDFLGERDPAELCERKYATQRIVYALAALRAGASRVEVAYCFLERSDEPVISEFSPADAPRLEEELLSLAADLLAGSFAPTSAPHRELCRYCPGMPALCSWDTDRTMATLAS